MMCDNLESSPVDTTKIQPDFINELERKLNTVKRIEVIPPNPPEPIEVKSAKITASPVKGSFFSSLKNKLTITPKAEVLIDVADLRIGDFASDGSIYLGRYIDKDWFVTAADAKNSEGKNLTMGFNFAANYAKKLKAHGHNDWQVPPIDKKHRESDILIKMYQNAHTGKFNGTYEEKITPDRWYWSSTPDDNDNDCAQYQSFYINESRSSLKGDKLSVRCVRSQPHKL